MVLITLFLLQLTIYYLSLMIYVKGDICWCHMNASISAISSAHESGIRIVLFYVDFMQGFIPAVDFLAAVM